MRVHWPLINLAILFILPIAAAAYMLLFMDAKHFKTVQHGMIIDPPQQLQAATHKWIVIYAQPARCDTICAQQKQMLNNMHVALGADSQRVNIITTAEQLPINVADAEIIIINPQGFYVMHYAANTDYSGLLKDLRRLLKYSHA